MKNKKTVYATMTGDLFHRGHLEFIKKAKALGDALVIGLHPDDVVKRYKREPVIPFKDRKKILESIKGVTEVVEDCMDYRSPTMLENLKKYKIDIAVHGDDWLPPLYKEAQKKKMCKVVQVPTYPYITTTKLLHEIRKTRSLRNLLEKKKNIVIVSAGDSITAKLIEEADFDGIWISGFEASARLGLADNGTITMTEMLERTKIVTEATSLPVMVDVDNGYGGIHNFIRTVKEFEKIGCSAVCVEDNIFPKQNSLWGGKVPLLSMKEHGAKIRAGKDTQKTKDFMIVARTEALIRGYGMAEAIKRSKYYADCGADMILMHSRESTGKEALQVPKHWKSKVPLVIVPTKFPQITNKQLFDSGYSVIVLANQTERVKIKAIRDSLKIIKKHDSVNPIEQVLSATLDDLRNLTPIKETQEIDRKYKY
ncbi:MAG: isocitrate lyase/phosphoenolpyruvate mutase family protein [Endomicrobiales bacterium]|nr:isocitrate lyase/phosphoenolpyruvate mutase family protein [Endomicrobiales bacterium]